MTDSTEFPETALKALCKLNGVGPATASLLLYCFSNAHPFFSDEATEAVGLGKPKAYDIPTYRQFWTKMQSRAETEDCNVQELEERLWTEVILERYPKSSAKDGGAGEIDAGTPKTAASKRKVIDELEEEAEDAAPSVRKRSRSQK